MNSSSNPVSRFIQEIRNRRVFRVATVYMGSAFVILEATEMIFPRLGIPDVFINFILALLAVGFPIAVGLAWTFQVTPDGLRRSPATGEKQSATDKPFTGNSVIVVLLLIIIALLAYPRFTEPGRGDDITMNASLDEKSIAVLPFTNFSSEAEDSYFADGIHDDILTQLSKIRDLRVISRTTMMKYRDTELDMQAIASELGAANILEGSVRRAGDQVRIVAQLIKADSDEHLWAETYDREYADIFAIQSDVAHKIADALKSTLSDEEERLLASVPTTNMEAYDYFLRGNQYWYTKTTQEGNEKAIAMYEKALELDPRFGLAWARVSVVHSVLFQSLAWDPSPARKVKAYTALQEAERLVPDNVETHFARGIYHLWCEKDHAAAMTDFEAAFKLQPSHAEVAHHLGNTYADLGIWDRARHYLHKAYELEPDNIGYSGWWAGMNLLDWEFERAEDLYRIGLINEPEDGSSYLWTARTIAYGTGDLTRALKILQEGWENAEVPDNLRSERFKYYLALGQMEAALQTMEGYSRDASRSYYRTWSYWLSGDAENLQLNIDSARVALNELKAEFGENEVFLARMSRLAAIAGDRELFEDLTRRYLEMADQPNTRVFRSDAYLFIAENYAILGEPEQAVEYLAPVISPPSLVTPWRVVYSPFLDEVRQYPKIRKLLPPGAVS